MRKTPNQYLLILFLFCAFRAAATGDSLRYLTLKDTIFLSLSPANEKIFEHHIERKQTLFSLARFYGLSVEELYGYNPGLENDVIHVGQAIKVPIPNRSIIRYWSAEILPYKYVPVVYVVRQGDTMFRIARVVFRMPIDTLLQRNGLSGTELRTGQLLHVGWMSVEGIPEEYHQFTADPLTRRNAAMHSVYERSYGAGRLAKHQGVAFWQKDSKQDLDFYALHRFAPINSVIEVTNPMTQRVVYVKVVGRIPDRSYGDEVIVVLSPLSAKALGAKDQRFFVRVTYPK